jgi:predicted AAA+ superfamily ATPase
MYKRLIEKRLRVALADTPVVLLNGARQTGKTTLVREVVAASPGAVYRTMDDAATMAAAASDPAAFVRQPGRPLVIDEVQRVPELFAALKLEVDRIRTPGRYLLTGSANVLLLPRVSDSLAGRMEILTLDPLSQCEMDGGCGNLLSNLLEGGLGLQGVPDDAPPGPALEERVVRGGYPEAVARTDPARRTAWFGSYVTTILQRDIRDIAHIEGLTDMPRLLALLAARTASLLNVAELSRSAGIAHNTLKRYLTLLETTFLTRQIPAWSRNRGKRFVKAPKIHVCDTGIASYLMDVDVARARHVAHWGHLVESFVVGEVLKQTAALAIPPAAYHFRLPAGPEVDLVLEDRRGRVAGIEIKASARVGAEDFAGLKALADQAGEQWVGGLLFYTGDVWVPFGDNLYAAPMRVLWTNND